MQLDGVISRIEEATDLKNLVNELNSNAELRTELASVESLWKALVPLNSKPKFLLANNLSACHESGNCALKSGFWDYITAQQFNDEFLRLKWQILANLALGCAVLPRLPPSLINEMPLALNPQNQARTACLYFIQANISKIPNLMDLEPVLNAVANDKQVLINADLVQALKSAYLAGCVVTDNEFNLVNVVLEDINAEFWTSKPGKTLAIQVINELTSTHILEYTTNNGDRTTDEAQFWWRKTLMLLECCNSILLCAQPPEVHTAVLEAAPFLIQMLISTKSLPARNKLTPEELSEHDFPYIRTALLSALACIALIDEPIRDVFRESGGLAAVLDCCVIDANNPFMKERAVVCLRYLMANNSANQEFVAQLERLDGQKRL